MAAEEEAIIPNGTFVQTSIPGSNPPAPKRKRNLPGTPDPEAEVIALSPKTLMATNRFLCEICGKGFQRDQNLQLHRRGHNLPWKLKQRTSKEVRKRVYICPEKTCVHHHPSRALGDLTGIKKHFCRKHGEKKWKCEKCSKRYAVQSDWKAHSKTCGTREYKCDCGTLFSRRDSFITHRAFCDALAEETARVNAASSVHNMATTSAMNYHHLLGAPIGPGIMAQHFSSIFKPISTTNEAAMDETRQGLSLWMGHEAIGTNNLQVIHHQLGPMNSGTVYSTDPLLSGSNPLPSDTNYQLPWMFGNKLSANNPEELLSTTSISLPLSNVKENGPTHQLVSIPSLFSSQQHSLQTVPSAANMSATALLQKAAQIGATSTDASFLGSFKLKSSNSTTQAEDSSKYSGLYGSNNTQTINSLGSEHLENSSDITTLNQLRMYPAAKRQHTRSEDSTGGGGQTRDFLGVGMQAICHPSSINGWI
ncbi:hypothetical protein SLA2020_151340 [Shorea laevis]